MKKVKIYFDNKTFCLKYGGGGGGGTDTSPINIYFFFA